MGLLLPEQPGHEAQPIGRWRCDAQFVAGFAVTVLGLDELRRIDERAGVVDEVRAITVERVIPEPVVGVVRRRIHIALEVREGVGQVEIADLAFHRQRGLVPTVVGKFRVEVLDLQVANAGIEARAAVGLLLLAHDRGADRPVLVEIELQRQSRANGIGIVVIFPGEPGVIGGDAGSREGHRAVDVVDITGIVFFPADQTDRRSRAERYVDHALDHMADAAAIDRVDFGGIRRCKSGRVRLLGDDAHRAGLRTGAVQGALRTSQRLDPLDVVHVDVERALDGGDRLLVKIHADAGPRARMVAVATAGDAAHIHLHETRPGEHAAAGGAVGQAGDHLGVVGEAQDVGLFEFHIADRLDADRDFLQVFLALLRSDGDFTERCRPAGRRGFFLIRRLGVDTGGLILGRGLVVDLRKRRRADRKINRNRQGHPDQHRRMLAFEALSV